MDSLLDSYDVEIFLDVNEPVDSVNLETVLKLDNSRYKDTINFTRSLQEKDKIKIHFEDYDIEIDKTCIAKYKNIGLYIHKNHIIDFLNKINEYYFIHKITNNNNGKVIFKYDRDDDNNITDINNITNEIEQQIYDLVVKINE
jgi:23S rRNA maturation-related 3'-5' exoribonuclease YhaM